MKKKRTYNLYEISARTIPRNTKVSKERISTNIEEKLPALEPSVLKSNSNKNRPGRFTAKHSGTLLIPQHQFCLRLTNKNLVARGEIQREDIGRATKYVRD